MKMKTAIKEYFDACNNGDKAAFERLFEPNASHYLPKGMFGPFNDIESLFQQWQRDVEENGSYWILDRVFSDGNERTAVAEWTAVKPKQHIYYRGVDVFAFDDSGRIKEVRVYYGSPRDPSIGPNELGGYDYEKNGWSVPKVNDEN